MAKADDPQSSYISYLADLGDAMNNVRGGPGGEFVLSGPSLGDSGGARCGTEHFPCSRHNRFHPGPPGKPMAAFHRLTTWDKQSDVTGRYGS